MYPRSSQPPLLLPCFWDVAFLLSRPSCVFLRAPSTRVFFSIETSGFLRCSATGLLFGSLTTRVNLGAVEAGRVRMGAGGGRRRPLLATTVLSMSVLIPGRK